MQKIKLTHHLNHFIVFGIFLPTRTIELNKSVFEANNDDFFNFSISALTSARAWAYGSTKNNFAVMSSNDSPASVSGKNTGNFKSSVCIAPPPR